MLVSRNDSDILRDLGEQIAEIACRSEQQETIDKWKKLNSLKPVRPMVRIDQIPWHEMNVDDELTLKTEDKFCRSIETGLRRTLYCWQHMPVDMVVDNNLNIGKVIQGASLGIKAVDDRAVTDPENSVVGHHYIDQLKTEDDLAKIRMPEISLNKKATKMKEEKAREIFDGILDVRMQGLIPNFAIWDRIVEWHGVQQSIIDLIDRPEFIHKLLSRVTKGYISMLEQLEEKGLLGYGQKNIHCSGAHTDELPAVGFDPEQPRSKDIWTSGMAQIFSSVSPAMHKEFEIDYAVKWYEKFGLVYYGCCEPLDGKIDIVKEIPNLRKISMSPWVDLERGAKNIGDEFVFSRKPSPAFLAGSKWNPDQVEEDLRETMQICKQYDCPLEFILKDISTVNRQPQRLWEWAEISMRVVRE